MKVDVHAHLWPVDKTSAAMRRSFDARGINVDKILSTETLMAEIEGVVDAVIVHTMAFDGSVTNEELKSSHEFVAGAMREYRGKIFAFCNVDVNTTEESLVFLRRYIEDAGFIGLKIHQNVQQIYANDERLFPLYEQIQKYGLPVMYHTGGIGLIPLFDKFSDISAIDEVACRYPEMKIIMGHAGRGRYTETASMLRKHANVYADISTNFGKLEGSEHEVLAELIKTVKLYTGGTDKLVFGSDYPFYAPGDTLSILNRCEKSPPGIITADEAGSILSAGDLFLSV